jgi:ribose transport system permease protein
MCILVSLMLRNSVMGRYLYAVGGSPDAARLSGISVSAAESFAYVISGGCAGLAGIILPGRATNVAPTVGTGYEILAVTPAIIGGAAPTGGRGRMVGAILGALTITLFANAMNIAGVTSEWQQVVTGIILLLAVLLDRITAYFQQRQTSAEIEQAPQKEAASAAMPKLLFDGQLEEGAAGKPTPLLPNAPHLLRRVRNERFVEHLGARLRPIVRHHRCDDLNADVT